jgi:hypothetical protein
LISPSCCRRALGLFRLLADSCDLPFYDLAIMLPSSLDPPAWQTRAICPFMISPSCCRRAFGIFACLANSCDLPFYDLAIMLPLSLWALPPAWQTRAICPFLISPSCCRRAFGLFHLLAPARLKSLSRQLKLYYLERATSFPHTNTALCYSNAYALLLMRQLTLSCDLGNECHIVGTL